MALALTLADARFDLGSHARVEHIMQLRHQGIVSPSEVLNSECFPPYFYLNFAGIWYI